MGIDEEARARLASELGQLLPASLDELAERSHMRVLAPGELLIERGQAPDSLAIVDAGTLECGPRLLGPGDIVNESALLGGQVARDDVRARRRAWVIEIPARDFLSQIERAPRAALATARRVALEPNPARQDPTRVIALVPGRPELDLAPLAGSLAELEPTSTLVVTAPRQLGLELEPESEPGRFARALARAEAKHRLILLVCPAQPTPWTRACVGACHEVVLVVDERSPHQPGPLEYALASPELARPPTRLVRLHRPTAPRAHGTRAWLDARPSIIHYHHVREREPADLARLARHLSERARALVLSGGGARCFAHIGVIAALAELGLEVDLVVGTSSGASVAAALAAGHELATLRERVVGAMTRANPLGRPTLPLVSLLDSKRTARTIEEVCEGRRIEDLWLPFACVSTNLSQARIEVHRRGPLAHALLASGSVPVLMPPVAQGSDLLCDGGLLDNLPVGPARRFGGRRVLASDVSARGSWQLAMSRPPPGVRGLVERARAAASGQRPLGLLAVAQASIGAALSVQSSVPGSTPDLCLRPPVERFGLDAFADHTALEAIGRAHALSQRASILQCLEPT